METPFPRDLPPERLSLVELSAAVRARHFSAVEVTRRFLDRAGALDGSLGCFLLLDRSGALAQAEVVDAALMRRESLPLAGVPFALKDNLCTRDLETTCGSLMLQGWHPPYDATAVARLRSAGAVLIGKLNMDEFAMGSSTENSAFRLSKNPWDLNRVPGGSSGGAAVAVSAGLAALALGSDTGGSIRQPAAFCGVTGLKPTYGRISRYGLVAFASSLDQIGPLTRSAKDAALALQVIGGPDPLDSTCLPDALPDLQAACQQSPRGLRIGVPDEFFTEGLDPAIRSSVTAALRSLQADGAVLCPISLPHTRYAVAAYYLIATAEASSNLARFDGVRYGLRVGADTPGLSLRDMYERTRAAGFGAEVKRRIMLGTFVLRSGYYDAYYKRASQVRTLIRQDFERAFQDVDLIATPTSPVPAFPIGERTADPLSMYLADIYTISCNLAGLPGISIPCGFWYPDQATSGEGALPIGLQFLGPPRGEPVLLRAAAAYQRLTDWHTRRPPLVLPASPPLSVEVEP